MAHTPPSSSKEDHSTGMAFIDVGPEGDNIIRITAGANGALNVDDIKAQANQIQQARCPSISE